MIKGFKSLFITDDENTENSVEKVTDVKQEKTIQTISFPKTENISFPKDDEYPFFSNKTINIETPIAATTFIMPENNDNPQLEGVIKSYEKGFESLNREGVDFYEFYKSVIIDNQIDNLTLYPMAFKMMQGLNPSFSKESAINDAKFYLENLENAYEKLKSRGESKRSDLLTQKTNDNSSLAGEVQTLEQQIKQLQNQLNVKKNDLSQIDNKYKLALNDVNLTLEANDVAKNTLISSIKIVVNNIIKTIK